MIRSDINECISLKGLKKQITVSTMTKKEICKKADISVNQLIDFLNNRYLPRTDVVAKLAYILDCEVDDLIEFEGIEYKPELDKYSMLPTTCLKNKLSYEPLINMFYDLYGVQYGEKLKKMYSKLNTVFPNKTLEKKHGDTEFKEPGKTCRLKIQKTESMPLYHVYEICNLIKCKPGCVFGYEGKYEEFPDNEDIKNKEIQERKKRIINIETPDGKIFPYYFRPGMKSAKNYNTKDWTPIKEGDYVVYNTFNYHIRELSDNFEEQTRITFEGIKEFLKSAQTENIYLYPIEKIDYNKEYPFYVNGDWRELVVLICLKENYEAFCKYNEGGYVIKYYDSYLPLTPVLYIDTYNELFKKTKFSVIGKSDYYKIVHSKNVSLFSKIDNTYESISHFFYTNKIQDYRNNIII